MSLDNRGRIVSHLEVGNLPTRAALIAAVVIFGVEVRCETDPITTWAFTAGLQAIGDHYFREVEFGDLAVNGLERLSLIDPAVQTSLSTGGTLEVSVAGARVLRKWAPLTNDASKWGRLVEKAVEAARARSRVLAETNRVKIQEVIFSGFLAKLDPNCSYVSDQKLIFGPPGESGEAACGIRFRCSNRGIEVVSVFPQSPAQSANIHPGDVITHLDSLATNGWSLDEAREHLMGPTGSELKITVAPVDGAPSRDLTITRQPVREDEIRSEESDGLLYLRIPRMNTGVRSLVRDKIETAASRGAQSVILDLRGNGGGLLDSSIALAALFLPARRPIVIQSVPDEGPTILIRSDGAHISPGIRIAVLINGGTAAGSEVVAAALQEQQRGVVIGSPSAGVGAVRRLVVLPGGAAMILTAGSLRTGSGRPLATEGVIPDVCTSAGGTDPFDVVSALRTRCDAGQLRAGNAPGDRNSCPTVLDEGELDVAIAQLILQDENLYGALIAMPRRPTAVVVPRRDPTPTK